MGCEMAGVLVFDPSPPTPGEKCHRLIKRQSTPVPHRAL
jgi:hypothetical protein